MQDGCFAKTRGTDLCITVESESSEYPTVKNRKKLGLNRMAQLWVLWGTKYYWRGTRGPNRIKILLMEPSHYYSSWTYVKGLRQRPHIRRLHSTLSQTAIQASGRLTKHTSIPISIVLGGLHQKWLLNCWKDPWFLSFHCIGNGARLVHPNGHETFLECRCYFDAVRINN